jgi:hypothetical protein
MTHERGTINVSVSMPDELVSAVRDYAGATMFDRYIAAAVEHRYRLEPSTDEPTETAGCELHDSRRS